MSLFRLPSQLLSEFIFEDDNEDEADTFAGVPATVAVVDIDADDATVTIVIVPVAILLLVSMDLEGVRVSFSCNSAGCCCCPELNDTGQMLLAFLLSTV